MRMAAGVVLTAGMVVQVLCRQLRVRAGGADLQQERCAARRHKSERHIRSEQQNGENETGGQITSMMKKRAHTARKQCQNVRPCAIGGVPFHRFGGRSGAQSLKGPRLEGLLQPNFAR